MDELTIIGGGCAGLGLAAALSEAVEHLDGDALLLEGRPHYGYDRTWCYWDLEEHPYRRLERFHWRRWKVRYQGREVVQASERYRYALLPSGLYYRETLSRINALAKIHVERGCEVQGYAREGKGWRIDTNRGHRHSKVLVEARGTFAERGDRRGLLQHFVGQYLHLSEPILDPGVATLMDFDVDQSRGIHFIYMLPLTHDSAYVADTYFGHAAMEREVYRSNIRAWLRERYGVTRCDTDGEEFGAIPMSCGYSRRRLGRGGFAVGGAGGAIKASSGYAFCAIQRQIGNWLNDIRRNQCWCVPPPPRARGLEWLDRIFLSYMYQHPGRMPAVFTRLFETCEPDALVRFLSDRPTAADVAQVIRAAPPLGMTLAALRGLPCWVG